MDQIAPVAARVPWMVAAGNHERDAPYTSLNKKTRNKPSYYKGWDSGTHFKSCCYFNKSYRSGAFVLRLPFLNCAAAHFDTV
jgi:hypothetical protein